MTETIPSQVGLRNRFTRPLAGALAGLTMLEVSDLSRWKSALERTQASGYGYYFPYVLAHQRSGKSAVLVGEDAGCLCVFFLRNNHLDLFVPPIPMNVPVARRCLERANDFNGDRSARILRIDANDATLAASIPGLSIHERRSQYLYAPRAFGELRGGKYRTLRYHVSKVRRLQALTVVPYDEQYAEACRTLLEQWSNRHRQTFGTSGDSGMSRRALALTRAIGAPDLVGELILLDGHVVGFAFGGELRRGLGCLYEAKTDLSVPGLAHFQCYSFICKLNGCMLVNGGSDARRAGIGQLKDSLRPATMLLEYRGIQAAQS